MKQATGSKKKAIHLSAKILKLTGGLPFSAIYGGIGQILMFHRVLPSSDKPRLWSNAYLEVTPEYLEQIINYYKRLGYHFLSPDELYEMAQQGNLAKPFVIFTFDDGYRDNLTHAYPLLKKHKVPFAIYITTDFPDKKAVLWWYALEEKILSHDSISFNFNGQKYDLTAHTLEEKEKLYQQIHNLIQSTPVDEKARLFEALFTPEQLSAPLENVLSWEEIRDLAIDELVTIGAHTVSHQRLGMLPDKQARWEISQSINLIESRTVQKVKHFAYPFGDLQSFGQREINILKENNILTSTTTVSKNITRQALSSPLTLPRIAVGMSMTEDTLDLIRFGVIPMVRNKGRR